MKHLPQKKAIVLLISLLAFGTACAQEVTIGTLLDLEDKIKVKKLNDELEKPSGNVVAAPPPTILPVAPVAKSYPTQAMEIHGVDQHYSGVLSMGGMNFEVKPGSFVNGYVVSAITPAGIELTKAGAAGRTKGKSRNSKPGQGNVIFAPLPLR